MKTPDELIEWTVSEAPLEYMRGGVLRYLAHGIRPGSTLLSIFNGDWQAFAEHADPTNAALYPRWRKWVWQCVPASAHGSPADVAVWCSHRGAEGAPAAVMGAWEATWQRENPVQMMRDTIARMVAANGRAPDTVRFKRKRWETLRRHPDLVGRLASGSTEATEDEFARMIGVRFVEIV